MLNKLILASAVVITISSCAKKLDLFPVNDLTPDKVYATPEGYKSVLAKIYGTLNSTGNTGAAGNPDIAGGLDEGQQTSFIRNLFNAQELPTDEAVVFWNDQTIKDFHALKWTSADPFIKGMYARPIYNITLINEYIRESTAEKLAERGITGAAATDIRNSNAEARFLRAFNYWVMLDLFGKSTFITEADKIGAFTPREISRPELYKYIVDELKAIESSLAPAKTVEYGRADQAAAWALLARIYLNAKVYTGTEQYTEALTNAKKVIDAGYSLHPKYPELFLADNDKCKDEFIFTINCDGLKSTSYGNTTLFVHCAVGDDNQYYGVNGGWFGYRSTKGLADKFFDLSGQTDQRALFTTPVYKPTPDQIELKNLDDFKGNGLPVAKYRNVRSDGKPVSDINLDLSDVDFPVFRLAEMYLIYAEATARGGAGDINLATTYINNLRKRAYGNDNGNIVAATITPQFVLDERARELYWEGHRRTDLIRFGQLTTGEYLWPWKGGVASGTAVDDKYNLFPVPAANRTANPNLTQNIGY